MPNPSMLALCIQTTSPEHGPIPASCTPIPSACATLLWRSSTRDPFLAQPGTAAVSEALATLLDGWGDGGGDSGEPLTAEQLERRLRAARLAPFADFGTVRSRYRLGGCAIDADVVRRTPSRRLA